MLQLQTEKHVWKLFKFVFIFLGFYFYAFPPFGSDFLMFFRDVTVTKYVIFREYKIHNKQTTELFIWKLF